MGFGVLTQAQREAIHRTSVRLLGRVGVRADSSEVLERLRVHGAEVDPAGRRVRLSEDLIWRLVRQCPSGVFLGDRDGGGARAGGEDGVCFWPGNALCLVEGGARRPIGVEDFARLTRLVDRLEHVDAMVGVAVAAFDPPIRDFCTLRLMARHTRKHLRPVITSAGGIEAVLAMADVIEQGRPEGAGHRLSFGYSVVSPLHWTETALALIQKTSGRGFPLMLNAEPMAGGTSPVTLAGSVAQANAETLAGVAIAQALEPGRPCFYNGGFAHVLDMRTTVALCGSPEVFLMGAASAEMARFYGLPCASWVSTEAMSEDAQAAAEKAMGLTLHVERGVNLIWGMGQLESQMSISGAQLVIDDEIAGQVGRLRRGIEVDPERLACEVMEEVGTQGDFLSHPHTLRWFREELRETRLGNRDRRDKWAARGGLDLRGQAQRRAEEILDREWEPILDEEQGRELERIETWWRKRIGR
ncbi:MAG: hypothetical protein A3F84_02710 [Candidatus Handelsmanbacteria bacterium RIFCSPLOWO2_12_FULL_64_10]|uniref:Trimethylamine methyltransferase n=1 Tax=Handelsmanbacteria sp. (strain RIFCSPLOWO2_12_FULL_64_10) TaxID=1817868 RepID=A0A1F6CWW3_HANXR|nr:MAG: hypothetical protein A3F84_02710 [Candidatus Handelsmanbacteria bacterium RIFCSPLOWO2_12_FULL_64_10]